MSSAFNRWNHGSGCLKNSSIQHVSLLIVKIGIEVGSVVSSLPLTSVDPGLMPGPGHCIWIGFSVHSWLHGFFFISSLSSLHRHLHCHLFTGIFRLVGAIPFWQPLWFSYQKDVIYDLRMFSLIFYVNTNYSLIFVFLYVVVSFLLCFSSIIMHNCQVLFFLLHWIIFKQKLSWCFSIGWVCFYIFVFDQWVWVGLQHFCNCFTKYFIIQFCNYTWNLERF